MKSEDLDALYARADALEDRGEYRKAFALFLRGARAGAANCAGRVANSYAAGCGVRRNIAESLRWDRTALRRGHRLSLTNIALTYASIGKWRLARRWWERAVADGYLDAAIDLAFCFLEGRGVRRDPVRAHELLRTVIRGKPPFLVSIADQEEAKALLGVLAARGVGTKRSYARARAWLRKATVDGDYPQAAEALANLDTASPRDVARYPPWRRESRA